MSPEQLVWPISGSASMYSKTKTRLIQEWLGVVPDGSCILHDVIKHSWWSTVYHRNMHSYYFLFLSYVWGPWIILKKSRHIHALQDLFLQTKHKKKLEYSTPRNDSGICRPWMAPSTLKETTIRVGPQSHGFEVKWKWRTIATYPQISDDKNDNDIIIIIIIIGWNWHVPTQTWAFNKWATASPMLRSPRLAGSSRCRRQSWHLTWKVPGLKMPTTTDLSILCYGCLWLIWRIYSVNITQPEKKINKKNKNDIWDNIQV